MSSTKQNSNNRNSPFPADGNENNVIYYRFMGASDVFERLPILGTTVRLLDVKQGIVQRDHPLLLKGIKSYCDGDSTTNENANSKEEEMELLLFDATTSKLYSNDNLSLPAGIQLLVFQFPSSTTALIMQDNDDDIDEEDNSDDFVKSDSSSQENDDSDSVTRCSCSVCINNTYQHNGDRYMDASSSTSEMDDQTLDGIFCSNEEENDDISEYTRSSSNSIYRIRDLEDDEDNYTHETTADADNSSDRHDVWSPNGNTSSGVVRLSLLALSAAIHATKTLIDDDVSEGLSELMSCPVMKHHLEWTVNARCAVLKIQDFYWHHVHRWSDIEDDDDDEGDDDSYDFYDDEDAFSDAAYFYSYYYYHHFFDVDDDYYSDVYHDFYEGEGEGDTDEDGYFS